MKPTTPIVDAMTARTNLCATLDCVTHMILNDLQLPFIPHCSNVDCFDRSFVLFERARFLNYQIDKLFSDGLVHVAAFDRSTLLTGVTESSPDCSARGIVKIRVFQNDHR